MALRTKKQPKYPRRLWSLVGFPGEGKSTFAARMAAPILVVDSDHRFDEVMHLVGGDVLEFEDRRINGLVPRIVDELARSMPEERVATIVVDSLTQIISPLVQRAVQANLDGENRNKMASFVAKATGMKLLQDGVSRWGTDVLWIYHLQQGRDAHAQNQTTTTIPATELARLQRNLNARLRVMRQGSKLGVHVEWCRTGRQGMTIWDDSGTWEMMPERLEEAMYDGLQQEQQARRESRFSGPDEAITWGVEQGAFPNLKQARAAYDNVKATHQPANAAEMWELWTMEVHSRLIPAAEDGVAF
ncbi:MAG: AAA family ATPase [Anaerolineae bacterium]|nr:AAA family ATPase [Anaerolineae bacterium]